MSTGEPLLRLRGVGKTFDPAKGPVFSGIDVDLPAGQFVSLVGPSGCGKSTLLYGIGGFRPFSAGEALLAGRPIGPPSRDRGIVFQDSTIPEFLPAEDNVALGLRLEGLGFFEHLVPFLARRRLDRYRAEARRLLERVGLGDHGRKYPRELSGGQKQRVAIAQALALRPQVLLMDEPFSALDPQTREILQVFLLGLQREEGMTVVFVTHDLEEAVFLGDRVLVLSQHHESPGVGARIVHDEILPRYDTREAKRTADFGALLQHIRDIGFRPRDRADLAAAEKPLRRG